MGIRARAYSGISWFKSRCLPREGVAELTVFLLLCQAFFVGAHVPRPAMNPCKVREISSILIASSTGTMSMRLSSTNVAVHQ
jgi:hypothetical protein